MTSEQAERARAQESALRAAARELFAAFAAHDSVTASNYGPMLTPRLITRPRKPQGCS